MSHIRPFCTALSSLGYAVWSIEYRRVGNGGEWPVMFTDVGAAADRLREVADAQNLDLSRVAAIGHSAGGHLALWLASRHKKLVSEAHVGSPINLIGVVSLAGITDLADTLATNICTGNVINLMGGTPQQWPARYAAASPIELAPLGVPQYLIHGRHDDDVPLAHVQPYVARAQACGDNVTLAVIEDCGHFELVTPNSIAWPHIQRSLATLFQQTP